MGSGGLLGGPGEEKQSVGGLGGWAVFRPKPWISCPKRLTGGGVSGHLGEVFEGGEC